MKTNYIHPSPGLYFGCGRSMPLDSRPVITVLALAAMAASTLGLLAYFRVLQGLSTATQWGLIGGGSGAAVTAIALGTGHLAHLKQARKEALQNITKEELSSLLMEIGQQKDPVKALEQLADDIPYEKLKEIFDETFPQAGDVQARTQEAIERARLFLEVSRTSSPSAHSRLLKAWDIFIETIDSFFIAFGIAEFFDPPESKFDSGFKFQKSL